MGRIRDLIKNFINPVEEAMEFDELALASGVSERDLKQLKSSMAGISWEAFAREDEENSKKREKASSKKLNREVLETKKMAQREMKEDSGRDRD